MHDETCFTIQKERLQEHTNNFFNFRRPVWIPKPNQSTCLDNFVRSRQKRQNLENFVFFSTTLRSFEGLV